jgi:hypothetical protein
LGVVVFGILINLASSYLKPTIDVILGKISENRREKNLKKKKAWQEGVKRLTEDEHYRVGYSNNLNYTYLKSIYQVLTGVSVLLISVSINFLTSGTNVHIMEGLRKTLEVILYMIGSLGIVLGVSIHMSLLNRLNMLEEANHNIGYDYDS